MRYKLAEKLNINESNIFGLKLLNNGYHHYKFRIINYSGYKSNWNHVIGISLDEDCIPKKDTYFKGYGFVSSKGKLINPDSYGNYGENYGKQISTNDIIDMYVDFTSNYNRTIRYTINNYDYGTAYNYIRSGTYRLAITLNHRGEKLQLISYSQMRNDNLLSFNGNILNNNTKPSHESWDKNTKGDGIIIQNNIVIGAGHPYRSIFMKNKVSSGYHHWRFKINSYKK